MSVEEMMVEYSYGRVSFEELIAAIHQIKQGGANV